MCDELINKITFSILMRNDLRNAHALLATSATATQALASLSATHLDKLSIAHELALKELDFIEKHAIKTYFFGDADYPFRLSQCVDAPLMLYAKGNANTNRQHVVSIVGTRTPSERGKDWCRRLVLDLADQVPNLTIVSGLAYGIDVVAHKAALESGIPTIIIPAHGLDRIYPSVHRSIAIQALSNGGILTEYVHGTEPERYHFVARNRIVAGLADAIVVVESKAKGGSLITAQMAIDYGRDVFALPGRYNDVSSEGCNNLIKRNQAQLITDAVDLVQAMRWEIQKKDAVQTNLLDQFCNLSPIQRSLLDILVAEEDGIHVNQLVVKLQLPYNEVVSELMMMELQGIIKGMPGGIWRKIEK